MDTTDCSFHTEKRGGGFCLLSRLQRKKGKYKEKRVFKTHFIEKSNKTAYKNLNYDLILLN